MNIKNSTKNLKSKEFTKTDMKDFCHSESLEKYYEPANSYFRKKNFCHPEDEADGQSPDIAVRTGETERMTVLSWKKYKTVRKISYLLKRFFAKYKFPFAGNCVRPAQNDGKILVPQCLSNLYLLAPSPSARIKRMTRYALTFSARLRWGEGFNNVKHLFTYSPIHLFTFKKLAAFTLAEVLITLGIIGVVAAMTIPALIQKNYEKRTVTTLIATQSILARALKMAEEEYGDVEGWGASTWTPANAKIIYEKLKPFLKIALDCGVEDKEGNCIKNTMYKLRNGANYINPAALNANSYKIKLLNGSGITMSAYPDGKTPIVFGIDTNASGLPNQAGVDWFLFRYENNSIRPSGAPDSTYPYDTHCKNKNSTGWGCAYWVVMNKNMNYLNNK